MKLVLTRASLFLFMLPFWAIAALWLASSTPGAAEPASWSGEWQGYSRTGQFVMVLNQSGDEVTGTVEPGAGRIEGRAEGRVLRGRWSLGGFSGVILLALSEDGRTLTGRFDAGEYLNARRVDESSELTDRSSTACSPRETLRSVISSMNDAFLGGDPAAARFFEPLLIYKEEESGFHNLIYQTRRRTAFWRILYMSTFRIFAAPSVVETDEARYSIGPDGGSVTYELLFRRDDDDRWKIVVGTKAELEDVVDRMLEDLGHSSFEEFEAARKQSPRETMRAFIDGTHTWQLGGEEVALATLDLSFLPAHLRSVEGPILADYLIQIIDRAGFVVWQEIPNDPGRIAPYVHYNHPHGSIVIERIAGDEGEPDRWLFSAETLQSAPVLFNAVQDMPLPQELGQVEPLTDFFRTRERIRVLSSVLLHRDFLLENWQWIALFVTLIVGVLAAWIVARMVSMFIARVAGAGAKRGFKWPTRIVIVGSLLLFVGGRLGIGQSGLDEVAQVIGVLTTLGLALLFYRLAGLAGGFLIRKAQATEGYGDEIVASLATGIAKLVVVISTAFICADIVGLPYEGVITGLGVGGVAVAFASRDTVSNMLGGMLLMADRPFKRGDLVETDGQWAMVEDVGLRSTRLKTFDDAQLIIPNAQLSDKAIVNWGKRRRRKVAFDIALTLDTPREKLDEFVERLKEVYSGQPRADAKECYIGLKTFGSSSIEVEFWGYFNVYGYEAHVRARHAFIGDVIELAKQVGVSFAFPTRTVHMMMQDSTSEP